MLWYVALIFAIASFFYLAVPGIGAFLVRAQWRHFRLTINEVSRYPTFDPRATGRLRNAFVGYFRFFGTLEAIQGEDRIWVSDGSHSIAAELKGVTVYLLPAAAGPGQDAADSELRSVPWSRIYSLPQGTTMLVGGPLFSEEGRGVFRTRGKEPPLVVIHDCRREQIMQRVIWSGRQRNEYWNQFTIPSLITGSFGLLLLAYFLLGSPDMRIPALAALAAGLGPASPFLPPAFPLYFLYRRYWKRARLMRAQRDVVRLPLRYFPEVGSGAVRGGRPEVGSGALRRGRPEVGSGALRRGRPEVGSGTRKAKAAGSTAPPLETRHQRAILLPDLEPYVMLKGEERPAGNELKAVSGAARASTLFVSEGYRVALPPETKRIDLTLPPGISPQGADSAYVFGAYSEDGDGLALKRPEDPMADLILVPGDPREIAGACNRAARSFELVSALFIGLNVAVNEVGLILLLARLIG